MAKTLTEIRSLARSHTRTALATLAGIMRSTKAPPAARIAAANSLLDRGWGKVPQSLAGDAQNPLRLQLTEIVRTIVDPASSEPGHEDHDDPQHQDSKNVPPAP